MLYIPVVFIVGYLFGSVPFGLLLTKWAGYGDIREIGSGNIGATNVLRTGNRALAALTLLFDGGKGAFAILASFYIIAPLFFPSCMAIDCVPGFACTCYPDNIPVLFSAMAGFGAVTGHCLPVWLKFKGGKGVATTLGTLLAAVPFAGLAACATWLAMAFIFRISSLSALTALAIAPIVTGFVYGWVPAGICLLISALVWYRHKDNIKRLLKGEEPKIGKKKEQEEARSA